MLHLQNILVPIDFSECAENALHLALDLAVRAGAELHLVHVWPEASLSEIVAINEGEAARDVAFQLNEATVEPLRRLDPEVRGKIDIVHELLKNGHPAEAILAYARDHEIDLIVMGTHGRRGLRRWILGSVTEEVLHEAPCPVLAVRPDEDPAPISHILVPVDFSEASGKALAQAKNLASLYDAALTLLFVAEEYYVPTFSDTGLPVFTLFQFDPEITAQATEALRRMDEETLGPEVPTTYLVRSGQAHRTIVSVANETQAGLVMMATQGLGQMHGIIGSVTDRVVRTAPCPVWTVYVEEEEGARLHKTADHPKTADPSKTAEQPGKPVDEGS